MLKLRKVELLGFKSFCEKTQITFSGSGVTCIVGPNGCGKSNIVDGISWVLGEQSHKSLRAERMADCIFNGTQKRPPMGLAEVSLTLVDPELAEAAAKVLGDREEVKEAEEVEEKTEAAPEIVEGSEESKDGRKKRSAKPAQLTKPGEVTIGRRLYRSGQSEYIVNGRVARLRDIQEIFMGTGLGPDSYAIIEQGRIGQILSSKPTDRRAIIEEAAGVSKYKTKRRLAEAKLESSKLNLARVNDILVEVEKQLGSLKRQASKARRYAEIREQMRGLLRTVLASKAKSLDEEAERLEHLLRQATRAETLENQSLTSLETEQARLSTRNYELEVELRQNQNLLGQCALELDRAENRIVFNRERMRELEDRGRQLVREIEQAASQVTQLAGRVRAHAEGVASQREENSRLAAEVQALADRAQVLAGEQQASEARLEELRQTAGRVTEELTRLHGEQAQAEEALSHHVEAHARLQKSEQHLQAECAEYRQRAEAAESRWQAAQAQAQQLSQAVREAQARIAEHRRQQEETSARFDRVREELAGARARRSSLEQILNDHSYTADAVQKLFAANGDGESRGFRAVGVLADYAEVEPQYESAVEQFLCEELEFVVVETFDHARAGISMLRNEVGGRATFFVDSLRNLKIQPGEPPMPFRADQGVISCLDRLVEFRDPLGAAAKQFLPKLRSAFLVETAVAAERLARDNPQYQFVIPDGTCYHGRLVSGGRPGEAGPLATKRELRSIEAEAIRLERAAGEAQAALRWLEDELSARQSDLEQSIARHVEAEKELVSATHLREQARTDLARLDQQLSQSESEMTRVRTETDAARGRAENARRQHTLAAESRSTADTETVRVAERLLTLRHESQTEQENLATRRAELATLAERLASAEALHERLQNEWNAVRQREAAFRDQQDALARERAELESGTGDYERQLASLRSEKARLDERKVQFEQEWEQARVRNVEVDDSVRLARQKLGDLREERGRHEVERARNDAERQHLRETCLAELNAQPEDLILEQPALLVGEELTAAETSYREMKSRIEAMGPVNMMALEEYQECEQRFTFLSRERDDLVKSIGDTLQTIKELDEVSRQRFQEAFEVINRHFAESFRTLFGGGTGEMRLTEPDSAGDSGIDVVAQPPGKRLQNVLLLSGGEKAMTALALLIAVFRFQPSPFCILDEVDAPLDEANVGRFAKMIAEMSAQTQFIIVTHNRRTMEMAPVLYGVTMQEPGVSKIVSVRWDEPQAAPNTNAA